MSRGFFIAGTDTEVGKTYVTNLLLAHFNSQGFCTGALKPIAAGAKKTKNGLRNEDALVLQKQASLTLDYHDVNPICLEQPIAPHIASAHHHMDLSVATLIEASKPLLNHQADITLVEGAGGWLVPLNEKETLADFAITLGFPVILVVKMTLGCINHTLLTDYHLQQAPIRTAGWIANCMDPNMNALSENIECLKSRLSMPLMSIIPYNAKTIDLNFDVIK